jgi:hypothetical protein
VDSAEGALAIGVTGHGHLNCVEASGARRGAQRRYVPVIGWIERTSKEAETMEGHRFSLPGQLLTLQLNL